MLKVWAYELPLRFEEPWRCLEFYFERTPMKDYPLEFWPLMMFLRGENMFCYCI